MSSSHEENPTFLRQVLFRIESEIEDLEDEKKEALSRLFPKGTEVIVRRKFKGHVIWHDGKESVIGVRSRTGVIHRVNYADLEKENER